jgi:antitoxin component of MazEF toxin-antitoxin module
VEVQTKIEKIGDGFGLLLPKELLEECGLEAEVTVTVHNNTLVVSPAARQARAGWAKALQAIPQAELDRDFIELQSFRDAPDEWAATGCEPPSGSADEKI